MKRAIVKKPYTFNSNGDLVLKTNVYEDLIIYKDYFFQAVQLFALNYSYRHKDSILNYSSNYSKKTIQLKISYEVEYHQELLDLLFSKYKNNTSNIINNILSNLVDNPIYNKGALNE
ncbi:MAG: hypothetical protein AB7D96_02320 [Arcobacteraceae bacterium]